MTLKQLEAFYWAAKLGTFAIAAKRLHVTQSSLSKRISELEDTLGHQLFNREGRRPSLTPAGEILLEKAATMLACEQDIRASLNGRAHRIEGTCRLGLTEVSATTWFPAFATYIERSFPDLALVPCVALSRPIETSVARGELDFALIAGPVNLPELQCTAVSEEKFVWTSAPGRFTAGERLRPEDLQGVPIINNSYESGLSTAFEQWLETHQFRFSKVIQCNSRAAILALTIAGAGVSCQPQRYVQPLVDSGLLMAMDSEPPLPCVPYNLLWRRDEQRAHVRQLIELVKREADFSVPNIFWQNNYV